MRALARLAIGVLLTGLVAGFSAHAFVDNGPAPAANTPNPNWRLGSPIVFENLTIFPVIGEETLDATQFITLDEGLRSGKVTITEIGAHGRRRIIGASRRVSNNAEVNKLMLTNRSGKTLVLIAGEMVVGGKQDRIVGHDCLVASSNRSVPLDVFCVEPHRWQENASFGQSRNVDPVNSTGNVATNRQANRSRRGSRTEDRVGSGVSGGMSFGVADGVFAPPSVREKAQAAKDQGRVWNEVAKAEIENNAKSATGNLNDVFANKQVSARLEDYGRAFTGRLSDKEIVGVIIAVGGKLRSADIFANHSLFDIYWPKLLKSYSLEAISAGKLTTEAVSAAEAETFLSKAEGAPASNTGVRTYRLVEHQSDKEASFELITTPAGAKRSLVHFNKVSKQ